MEVEKACELGLCYGVRRAVDMVLDAVQTHGTLHTLGPLAHNRTLLRQLESRGITRIDLSTTIPGPAVVIPTHGVTPDVLRYLRDTGRVIIDTTCPNVARAQQIVAEMAYEGLTIVIFGDSEHTEVRGLLGWTEGRGIATTDASSLSVDDPSSIPAAVGIIAQTTQRAEDFALFVQQVCSTAFAGGHGVRVVNTLCDATRRRQLAAATLARVVDAMIVIGGRDSANTQRLAETCSRIVETYLVETAEEIDDALLRGKIRIGLAAGASTPDSSIEQVERRLREI